MTHHVTVAAAGELGRMSADIVTRGVEERSIRVLGVATGSSPLPIYRALAARPPRGADALDVIALDEYVGLPAGHPETYRAFVEREIAQPLGIDRDRVRVPEGTAADPDAAARAYEQTVADLGGADLQIVGIGANGHLGFNEPGSSADSRTRVVALTERTRADNARFFDGIDEVPTHAITQGVATILSARRILLIATGRHKAAAVAQALYGPVDEQCPASALQHHPDVTVMLDEDAASLLSSPLSLTPNLLE